MTSTEIREALVAVEHAVDVPPVDQVAFRARVRAERRRRTAGRVLVGAVAAAAVVAAGVTVRAVLAEPDRAPEPTAPSPGADVLSDAVYFVLDGRLTAFDPRGGMRDLGRLSESVVGWTSERVYAIDAEDSPFTVTRVEYDDEGTGGHGPATSRARSPVSRRASGW